MKPSSINLFGALAAALWLACAAGAHAQVFPVYDPGFVNDLVDVNSPQTIAPGTQITAQNWTQYKGFMPLGLQKLYSGQYFWRVGSDPDFTITVGPTIHTPLPRKYLDDTEKYHNQVSLRPL